MAKAQFTSLSQSYTLHCMYTQTKAACLYRWQKKTNDKRYVYKDIVWPECECTAAATAPPPHTMRRKEKKDSTLFQNRFHMVMAIESKHILYIQFFFIMKACSSLPCALDACVCVCAHAIHKSHAHSLAKLLAYAIYSQYEV